MKKLGQAGVVVVLVLAIAVGLTLLQGQRQTALAAGEEGKPMGGPHYSVVITEAHNLLVTDNATNKLYFYTTDKDKPIGSPLKLRASIDLTKVGDPEIHITPHNLEKFDK
jgi:hypothetical protein